MIKCCIDNFSIVHGEYRLGGWGYKLIDGERHAIEKYHIDTQIQYQMEVDSRQDFNNEKIAFHIKTKEAALFYSILFKEVEVFASYGNDAVRVTIWEKLFEKLIIDFISNIKDEKSIASIVNRVISSLPKGRNSDSIVEQSIFEVDVGFESYCKNVIVGKGGFLFLTNGSNDLQKYYQQPPNENVVNSWKDLVSKRAEKCRELNSRMLQIIFPEKQSILCDKYPTKIESETANLKKINDELNDCEYYINLTEIFRDAYIKNNLVPFRKLDSHLTYQGAKLSVIEILEAMGLNSRELKYDNPILHNEVLVGDLGNRFGFGNFRENHLIPDPSIWEFGLRSPKILKAFNPESGHINSYYHWVNESASIKKKILIFGNSFFERGSSPKGLSFWFSRLFSEVIFIWSPSMLVGEIEKHMPDYVICQTVERFIPTLPTS